MARVTIQTTIGVAVAALLAVLTEARLATAQRPVPTLVAGKQFLPLRCRHGKPRRLRLEKLRGSPVVCVDRAALLTLPMEYLAFPTDVATGTFRVPENRVREKSRLIKAVLKLSGKVLDPLSERSKMLDEFVNHLPCQNPATGSEGRFSDYLRLYVKKNGYVQAGYIDGAELKRDPRGVFLRLLLIDRWVLYEARMFRGKDGRWFSLEDCVKGRFKSPYATRALDAFKNALQFRSEAKRTSFIRVRKKVKAHTASMIASLNTALYVVEANRRHLMAKPATRTAYEKMRLAALNARLLAHYRTPVKATFAPPTAK